MRLTLVVSDCPPVGDGGDPLDAPALPALTALLRAARRERVADWRSALLRLHAPAAARDLAPGVVALAALPRVSARTACLATPAHLLATPDHLRMPADGLLTLDESEGRALAADFDRTFDGSGLALHWLCGRFVLTGLPAGEGGGDPAGRLGSRLGATSGTDPAWRRLSSEIELWLHAHPINEARATKRLAAVNALWLWGGGAVPAQRPADSSATPPSEAGFRGEDPFVAGVAALAGTSMQIAPALPADGFRAGGRAQVIQLAVAPPSRRAHRTLADIDEQFIAPLLARLRAREIESIDLLMGDVHANLGRSGLARFWRRRRPWWEYLRR